ncbi:MULTISPECIES: L-aspartate oxidase [unclassified Niallia]|uniref:L-aspartate oxidase n=1 Tax=unclassified Niallia TaxID=2837522 RepID=UPI001EDBDBD0|nr:MULTISPECIES: L-aspartate oxidase [unclassified Niallia]MDL0434413.1 L-aspartate oxidase [Niallia sp. SS-2023]UPO89154.1 L-aspartate oxidase [Niallia sp. Man26]
MKVNVLIIGSGMASLQLARKLSPHLNVMILTKGTIFSSNSYLAQGGIAASISADDSFQLHALDTLEAGRFHNHADAVKKVTSAAPILLHDLAAAGCQFDQDVIGSWNLGMEGAHSKKRIVHSGGDETGKKVMEFLAATMPLHVKVTENVLVHELILSECGSCIGAKGILDDGTEKSFYADQTIIATGGCGQVYEYTSNAQTITGDGIALAYLAGANIADMEFIQFHPTLLYLNGKTAGLVSEAVRGEGAVLVNEKGVRIMEGVHPLGDLAPRHIVSQEIYRYLQAGKSVYLDISTVPNFTARFPAISSLCQQHGVDLRRNRIPVAPGCHFLMGGIETDLGGRTSINGLYAIGEAACTGLHGANRLASNSLLEGLYMGSELANRLNEQPCITSAWKEAASRQHYVTKLPSRKELQKRTMEAVGIVRTEQKLQDHLFWLESLLRGEKGEEHTTNYTKEEYETYFMVLTAQLITKASLQRTESRGGHYRSDYPQESDSWRKKTIILNRYEEKGVANESAKIATAT